MKRLIISWKLEGCADLSLTITTSRQTRVSAKSARGAIRYRREQIRIQKWRDVNLYGVPAEDPASAGRADRLTECDMTTNDTLDYITIAEAARRIEAGDLSPVELTQAKLARIAELDRSVGGSAFAG